jgi:hypothetical protein
VILVGVIARRRDDDVGRARAGDLLECVLGPFPDGRQPAFGQVMEVNAEIRAGQEGPGRVPRLVLPVRRAGQHRVVGPQPGLALGQREQRPARADLDVVRVRADGQDGQRPARGDAQRQRFHE